jgi:hypothetical protein
MATDVQRRLLGEPTPCPPGRCIKCKTVPQSGYSLIIDRSEPGELTQLVLCKCGATHMGFVVNNPRPLD